MIMYACIIYGEREREREREKEVKQKYEKGTPNIITQEALKIYNVYDEYDMIYIYTHQIHFYISYVCVRIFI